MVFVFSRVCCQAGSVCRDIVKVLRRVDFLHPMTI